MNRMLAGVSMRKFAAVGEPVGSEVEAESASTSKTSVSEMFVERTVTALSELMRRRLEDVRLAVMMLDGLEIAERCPVVAPGITTEGVKIPLGLWEGSTENATLTRTLLIVRHTQRNVKLRLAITGQLARALCSTNPCESMLDPRANWRALTHGRAGVRERGLFWHPFCRSEGGVCARLLLQLRVVYEGGPLSSVPLCPVSPW